MWEQFKWRAVSMPSLNLRIPCPPTRPPTATPCRSTCTGVHAGGGYEQPARPLVAPVGGFSASLDAQAALYINFAKERASYELGDRSQTATRNRNTYTIVPGAQVNFNLWWYPIDAISVRVGYNALALFNTIASPEPVDFNYGALAPGYVKGYIRTIDGLNAGISFVF